MDTFSAELLDTLSSTTTRIDAWAVLPNHYHAVILTESLPALLHSLGRLHGRCSFLWNREDNSRGRKVWFNTLERTISDDFHHFTTIQYVHHNPVRYGHAQRWTEWKWSSAASYLEEIGREEAERRWKEYPVTGYGSGWDD